MISKILKSSSGSTGNRVRYCFGRKKHDHDIKNLVTIDTNCFIKPEFGINQGNFEDLESLISMMDTATKLKVGEQGNKRKLKPVFHAMITLDKDESLTPDQWKTVTRKYLKKLGFKKSNAYVAVLHQDTNYQHIHIVANRISLEPGYPMVSDKDDFQKSMEVVWEMEDLFGLKKADRPEETWNVTLPERTLIGAAKVNRLPYQLRLAAKIGGCVERTREKNGDMIMFVRSLRRQGVYVHLRYDVEGAPKGISYEFEDRVMAGSQLKRARCTWQKLTGQEGIRYEPGMLQQLKVEISKRAPESKERAERARDQVFYANRGWIYMYFVPANSSKAPFIKLKVKKSGAQVRQEIAYKEAMELIEAIMMILKALFGDVGYTAKKGNAKVEGYHEWDRTQPFPILHPGQPQAVKAPQKAPELA